MSGGPRFHVPVGIVALAVPPDAPVIGETYFDTALGQLQSWDGTVWVGSSSDTELDADFVNVPGDGMTGELILPDQLEMPPSAPAVVAAKGYVDQLVTVSDAPPTVAPARDGLIWTVIGAGWSPASIPGLTAWFDPAQDVGTYVDGESVGTYIEHSPHRREFVPIGGTPPTFRSNPPRLDFPYPPSAALACYDINLGPDGLTYVAVNQWADFTNSPMLLVSGPAPDGWEIRHDGTSMQILERHLTTGFYFSHPTPETPGVNNLHILRVQSGVRTDAWVNNSLYQTTASPAHNSPQTLFIGRSEGGYYYSGIVAEALVFEGPISDADLTLLTDYLIAKHGLTFSFDSGAAG